MRRILALVGAIATLAAGVTAAVALGAGTSASDTSTGTTTAATGTTTTTTASDTSTGTTIAGATTTTAPDTATGTTTTTAAPETSTAAAAGATTDTASSKVWVCHHTGSWKHPYHPIHISRHALAAHRRHGDVTPGAGNSCPTTQPAGAKTHGRGNGQRNNAEKKDDHPGKGDDKTESNGD